MTAGFLFNGKKLQTEEINQLRTLINASPDVICSFDKEGRFLSASRASLTVWGYTEEEILGRSYLDFVIDEDREKSMAAGEQIRTGMDVNSFENRFRRKDGSVVPMMWSAKWDPERKIMYCVAKDITEKKEAEEQARSYEDRLSRAYQLSQIGWWEWDVKNDRYHASDELYMIYGFDREECPDITLEKFLSCVHPKYREKVKQDIALVDARNTYEYSHWFTRPSGDLIFLLHHVRIHRDETGGMVRINGTTRDITAKRKAKLALRKSREKLQNILDSIQDCFFVLDRNWRVSYWNKKAEEVLERKGEAIIGKVLWDEFKGSISLLSYTEYHKAVREQVAVRFEDYAPSQKRWFEINAYPSKTGLSVYFKDITERKQQEQLLKISNERYQFVAVASTDVIWDWDLITGEMYANESFEEVFGAKAESKTTLKIWSDQLHAEDKNQLLSSLQEAIQNPAVSKWKRHYRILRKDKEVGYLSARAIIIRNQKKEAIRMVGSIRDITEIRKREEAEKNLQLRYKLLFDDSPMPTWIFDPKTLRFLEVNEAAIRHYGYSREDWLSMTVYDIRAELDKEKAANTYKDLENQFDFRFHGVVKHRKKNGALIDVELTSHALKFRDTFHVVAVANDVTEKTEAQRAIARAIINTQEKERSVIGKELHDNVNQLLTTAKLYIQNASYFPDQKEFFLGKSVEIIQKSITEIRGLSKALITPTLSDLGFKDSLDELVAYYRELNLFQVELNYFLNEDNLEHELKLSIYRILQELFNNTIKYARAKNVRIYLEERTHYLRMVYLDDGEGFQQKQCKKGLGLNNIKNRVDVFKGKFRLKSEPGNGVTALLVFPMAARAKAGDGEERTSL